MNTEQASKQTMWEPTRQATGKADGVGEVSETRTRRSHRGSGGSTYETWSVGNKGSLLRRKVRPSNDDPARGSVGGNRWRMGP
jgi:hypothetical protein